MGKRLKAWRSAMKAKKAQAKYEKEVNFMPEKKTILTSSTSQTIAVSGGSVIGVLAFLRNFFPDLIPWPVEHDATFATVGAGIVTPIISRLIAWRRGKV